MTTNINTTSTTSTVDFSDRKKYIASRDNILQFFLTIYRLQSGAAEEISVDYELLSAPAGHSREETYELRLTRDGEKTFRRMSIAPLGDGSGSKSMCFKVIYDDMMVIKIPPVPIQNFDIYIEHIEAERQIAQKLRKAIECIAPEISALLRKIPPFSKAVNLPSATLEQMCVKQLKKYPRYQDYLKIGDSFVFFMNLSKYSFLSQVIEKLHDHEHKIHKEMMKQSELLWNMLAFEEKYGNGYDGVFFGMNEVFNKYEDEIKSLLRQYGILYSISPYKIKDWFLIHLSGNDVTDDEGELPPECTMDLNRKFKKISKDYQPEIDSYRQMIRDYVFKVAFSQNKALFGGIITNLLKLIAWLKEKGVAIRDLKPDNLFVVGDPTKNPFLLASTEDYSLGLIDFETAVCFNVPEGKFIEQPMLAGTPSYATPSHLFLNSVLSEVFGDLPQIFHLQDWHAVIGMIFYVVTGKRLFDKTRKMLSEIRNITRLANLQKRPVSDAFKIISRMFWQTAGTEFKEKTLKYEDKLKAVESCLSDKTKEMFRQEVLKERVAIAQEIQNLVHVQKMFRSEKSRQDLIRSSRSAISRCRSNWENNVNVPQTRPIVRKQVIEFFQNLERLKLLYEQQNKLAELFSQDKPKMSANDMLIFMFNIVSRRMYRQEWNDLTLDAPSTPSSPRPPDHEETITHDETVKLEKTISLDKL